MEAEKFIHDFWKANEISNFSKEATVLFFYLIYVWENEKKPDVCASCQPTVQSKGIQRERRVGRQ